MPTKAVFRCQFCDATPDHGTQRSLQGQVTERMFGEYLDAFPGRWLVWNGGGTLGPRRYACRKHRGDLVAYLRYHYATVAAQVWKMPPYEQRWPDEKRPHMGGSMGIVKFGLRGGLLQDPPRAQPPEPATATPADVPAAADAAPAEARPVTPSPPAAPTSDADPLFPPGALFLPEDMFDVGGGLEPPAAGWPTEEAWPGGFPPDDPRLGGVPPEDPWGGGLPPDDQWPGGLPPDDPWADGPESPAP